MLKAFLVLFLVAMAISSVGWIRLVYFISFGYAFSVTGMVIATFFLGYPMPGPWVLLQLATLAVYGIRLGSYVISRERKESFAREKKDTIDRTEQLPIWWKPPIWVSSSLLYVLMFTPALGNVIYPPKDHVAFYAQLMGVAVMVAGFIMETVADLQKSAYKQKNPTRFCDTGLYTFVRSPNYLGEILVWTGNFIAGIGVFLKNPWFLLMSIIGYVLLVLIMMGSAKRLEAKQIKRYGDDPEFQAYRFSVPALFPFTKMYSMQETKLYID